MTVEILTFPDNRTALDLLLMRRFRREVAGLFEQTLARNPGLADLLPYPPAGTQITVATPAPATAPSVPTVSLFD